ncbi:MAG TPA: DUF547 domain-containing protein [Planctomycetaceae bacterium]|nr:DUF547 domain-containing protein [Planctomycetaceae bacterium]
MFHGSRLVLFLAACIAFAGGGGHGSAQQAQAPAVDALHRPFDDILDMYVRDGLVYYRALRQERNRFDRYVASLDVPAAAYNGWARERQMAFWVNAYNAFALETVIDHYPIRTRTAEYPAGSIRQIPGAFEQIRHRAAGRSVTLDEIEKTILPAFGEPRLFLALGRGAVGSGRLRSEAFTAARLTPQLDRVQSEFVTEHTMMHLDRAEGRLSVTPIVSWNAEHFVAAYDPGETGPHAQRSPIERAIVAFIAPHLLPLERQLVQKNEFRVTYHDFDWRLNDLTGR